METGRPADVLPDREQATVEQWLRAHPGTQVVCRDRAGAYAAAVRGGRAGRGPGGRPLAPVAQPVRVRRQGRRPPPGVHQRSQLRLPGPARRPAAAAAAGGGGGAEEEEEEGDGPPAGLEAVVRERYAAVHGLRAAGKTQDQAAAALGLSSQTAGRFWRAASAQALLKTAGTSALDPFKPYLRERWQEGTTTIAALHREITALGYGGSELTT